MAALVFSAGFPNITMIPLDATHKALINLDQCATLRASAKPAAEAAAIFVEKRIEGYKTYQKLDVADAAPIHDALCVAALVDPSMIEAFDYHVAVEIRGELTVGRTVIDVHRRGKRPPNCHVAMDATTDAFARFVIDTLTGN